MFLWLLAIGLSFGLAGFLLWSMRREITSSKLEVRHWLKEMVSLELSDDSRRVLDEGLNELMDTYRRMIPMGETFLTGSLAENIKIQANKKICSILPFFQRVFIDHGIAKMGFEKKIKQKIAKIVVISMLLGAVIISLLVFILCFLKQIY